MYNHYVLTRPYQHFTTKALIELHDVMCISLDISIMTVRFENCVRGCRVPAIRNELTALQQNFLGYLTNCLITCQTMDYPYQRVYQLINKLWK